MDSRGDDAGAGSRQLWTTCCVLEFHFRYSFPLLFLDLSGQFLSGSRCVPLRRQVCCHFRWRVCPLVLGMLTSLVRFVSAPGVRHRLHDICTLLSDLLFVPPHFHLCSDYRRDWNQHSCSRVVCSTGQLVSKLCEYHPTPSIHLALGKRSRMAQPVVAALDTVFYCPLIPLRCM